MGSSELQSLRRIEELTAKAEYHAAIPLAQEMLGHAEITYGIGHTNTATALNRLGEIFYEANNFTNSSSLHKRALEIREKWLGSEHQDTATSLENLAKARYGMSDYSDGIILSARSLRIRETAFGAHHTKTGESLALLAQFYCANSEFTKAEQLATRSLQIYMDAFGEKHQRTALAFNLLGDVYRQTGHYTKAITLLQKSLVILTHLLGPEDQNTLIALNNLAHLHESMGEYAKADQLFEQSVTAFEKIGHLAPARLATALDNRAGFYARIGDYTNGLPLCERALKLREQVMGPEHPDTALSLMSLAYLYEGIGDYSKTATMFKRGLEVYEKTFGPEHPQTATALNCLLHHYIRMRNYSNAVPVCVRSLRIREKTLGPEHPETAAAWSQVGRILQDLGGHKYAEPYFEKSLAISEKVYGPGHMMQEMTLRSLVFLKLGLGKHQDATNLARKYKSATESAVFDILAFAPEQQRLQSQGLMGLRLISTLAAAGSPTELGESILRIKGAVLDSILEDESAALTAKDMAVSEALEELRAATRRLTRIQIQPVSISHLHSLNSTPNDQRILSQRIDALQKQLARNLTSLGQLRRGARVTVAEVQSVLGNDTALLEFVRYAHYLGNAKFELRYGAVLLGNGETALVGAGAGEPIWVSLGSAQHIEDGIQSYRAMMSGSRQADPVLLRSLYAQLIESIQSKLPNSITKLIISPDAQLNFLSFGTLVDAQGQFLGERFSIRGVASGRDLLMEPAKPSSPRRYDAFANPSFSESPNNLKVGVTRTLHTSMQATDRRDFTGVALEPLPNTSFEAQFLRDRSAAWRLHGAIHVGSQASELEVKSVKSPYILHIATHGFLLPDDSSTNRTAIQETLANEQRKLVVFRNPMHRSGLAFAGAQLTLDAWRRGETPDPENDGILMAQEVRSMDLKKTWLVVLSACDTGIGEARSGEGVMGLRRGFVQAGAQNLLMTLWPISDKWSVEIMKAFYEKAMTTGDAPQAMAEVQAEWLGRLRKEKGAVIAARIAGPFVLTSRGASPKK